MVGDRSLWRMVAHLCLMVAVCLVCMAGAVVLQVA